MPSWWPPFFLRSGGRNGSGAHDDDLSSIVNVAQTDQFRSRSLISMPSADDADARGGSKSLLESRRIDMMAMKKNDPRAMYTEVDSISMLADRYAPQFAEAERIMKAKVAKASSWTTHDSKADRHFESWLSDQAQVQKKLEIHWLDNMIDDPITTINYMARVGTTAGILHGVGRTARLYRSMDKVYAKLNGVTLSGMIFDYIPRSVVGGACVAASSTIGLVTGNGLTNIVSAVCSGDVSVPDRTWVNVVASQINCGIFAGITTCLIARNTLTHRIMWSIMAGFTSCATITGLYCGYVIYRPHAMSRSHGLYEPYWNPWNVRMVTSGGSLMTRGKYV